MKIAVVGSRAWRFPSVIHAYVHSLPPGTVIVSGGAPGVDREAERAAHEVGLEVVVIRPDWVAHGRSAGFRRNWEIVQAADEVVAFWDDKSRGTKHTIDIARKAGKRVTIVHESDYYHKGANLF